MSDMVEMMLDGLLCESCGELIDGDATEYPRKCDECELENA